jgi:hypothetical protein
MVGSQDAALFRWENYIGNLNLVFPCLFSIKYFATHNKGAPLNDFIEQEYEIKDLSTNVEYLDK